MLRFLIFTLTRYGAVLFEGATTGCSAAGNAETLVDLSGDLTMKVVEIVTGAGLRRKPAVNRHVLLLHLSDKGLVCLPSQCLDPVSLANIGEQGNQSLIGCIRYLVRVGGVACHFNGNGTVVIACRGRAPGTVFLLNGQAD